MARTIADKEEETYGMDSTDKNRNNSLLKLVEMREGNGSQLSKGKAKFVVGNHSFSFIFRIVDYGNAALFASTNSKRGIGGSGLVFTERVPGGLRSHSQLRPSVTSSTIENNNIDDGASNTDQRNILHLTGVSKIVRVADNNSDLFGASKLIGHGTRRVHQDGVVMLDRHLLMKDSALKVLLHAILTTGI